MTSVDMIYICPRHVLLGPEAKHSATGPRDSVHWQVRGTKLEALIHVCDFWATLADALGLPVHDPVAHAAGLPALDSISFWPQLSGENSTSAR